MARHTTAWLLVWALFIGCMGTLQAQDTPASLITPPAPAKLGTSDLIQSEHAPNKNGDYAKLLDKATPLAERQAIFREMETRAQAGSHQDMYVVGSLYRIGEELPASPVARDLDKARLYLSNAATHGEILAMAKMAELEVGAHRPMEAMTWAQIYGHYAQLQPAAYRPSEGYLAELVERASRGIAKSQLQDVVDHLNLFITTYDASVREGSGKTDMLPTDDMAPRYVPTRSIPFYNGQAVPSSGFVDYLVAFGPDGGAVKVFTLDATPDFKLDAQMRGILSAYKVAPSTHEVPVRYAFIPLMFDDQKFRLAPKSKAKAP